MNVGMYNLHHIWDRVLFDLILIITMGMHTEHPLVGMAIHSNQ